MSLSLTTKSSSNLSGRELYIVFSLAVEIFACIVGIVAISYFKLSLNLVTNVSKYQMECCLHTSHCSIWSVTFFYKDGNLVFVMVDCI